MSITTFSIRAMRAAALARPYPGRKAYLSVIRHTLGLPRGEFARLAIAAHTAGMLALGRADMMCVFDRAEIRDSEIRHLGAEYHFLVLA